MPTRLPLAMATVIVFVPWSLVIAWSSFRFMQVAITISECIAPDRYLVAEAATYAALVALLTSALSAIAAWDGSDDRRRYVDVPVYFVLIAASLIVLGVSFLGTAILLDYGNMLWPTLAACAFTPMMLLALGLGYRLPKVVGLGRWRAGLLTLAAAILGWAVAAGFTAGAFTAACLRS